MYRYSCGGFASWHGPCGASDCGSCRNGAPPWEEEEEEEEEVRRTVYRVVRKSRKGPCQVAPPHGRYEPGDLVRVESGFWYTPGGPRLGYFRREVRVGLGPHHDDAGAGEWRRSKKGSYEAYHKKS